MAFSFRAMWNYKCPRCRKGDLFKKPLKLTAPLDMHDNCPKCGQKYEPETGFYYGAMFISYIFTGWYLLIPTLILVFAFNWSIIPAMLVALAIAILSYLRILRGSRSLWLHAMVKYDPKEASKSTA